jgi:hypothetical protein
MLKVVVALSVLSIGSAAHAQNSTTNCDVFGNTVNCRTNTTPSIDWDAQNRQQQQLNQSFQNLGAAIAANRERRRERKEAEAAQAQAAAMLAERQSQAAAQRAREDAVLTAMQAAIDRDNAPTPPPPTEKPVFLSCTIDDFTTNLALYERAGRVDVTEAGVTKARAATFTPDAVSWQGSVWRSSISRVDLKLVSVSILPEAPGAQVTAACSLAERKF